MRTFGIVLTVLLGLTAARADTVAYYRFEEGADGAGATGAAPSTTGHVLDSSGNGYHGTAFVSVKVSGEIDVDHLVLYDKVNEVEVSDAKYTVAGNTLIVDASAVGTVPAGGAIEFEVYYRLKADSEDSFFFEPILYMGSFGISPYWISAFVLVGVVAAMERYGRRRDEQRLLAVTMMAGIVVIGMLHLKGVIA